MNKKADCPFCHLDDSTEILIENATFILKFDRYPVADGHILLIPRRHVESFVRLNKDEVMGFFELLKKAQERLLEKFKPDGFTIGINQGQAAGQTIEHLHIHLIPRYHGDVDSPEGGIRKIIPNKVIYPPN